MILQHFLHDQSNTSLYDVPIHSRQSEVKLMNTFIKAAILSISTALIALPALAAPQEQHQQHQAAQSHGHAQKHTSNGHQQPTQTTVKQATVKKSNRPSQDWKVGQKLPSAYHNNAYKADHQKYKKLSKPGKNQQWIKVNGDYVLTDIRNHSIIKIIAG